MYCVLHISVIECTIISSKRTQNIHGPIYGPVISFLYTCGPIYPKYPWSDLMPSYIFQNVQNVQT